MADAHTTTHRDALKENRPGETVENLTRPDRRPTPVQRAVAGTNHTTRRALLKAVPGLALVGAGPVDASATPVMVLFRKHQEITAAATAWPNDDNEELERLFYQKRDRLEDEMMALPTLTAQDMAAKMIVAHAYGDHSCLSYSKEPVWREARALVGDAA
jgi:hypothetical protein